MKIKWCDRLALIICALIVLAVSGGLIYFGIQEAPVMLSEGSVSWEAGAYFAPQRIIVLAFGLLTLLCAIYLLCLPHKLRGGKGAFVVQQTDNGELRISVKAIESLVQKCIDMHEEIHVVSMDIRNGREGVVIDLRISLANNISIPLAVVSLQKQIKQYLIVSSGIDVREVRVSVETTAEGGTAESPYRVGVDVQPSAQTPVEKAQPAAREKKKTPLHQRMFGREETPEIVPEKPAFAEVHEEVLTKEIFAEDEPEAPSQPEALEEAAAKEATAGEPAMETADENAEQAEPTPEQPA